MGTNWKRLIYLGILFSVFCFLSSAPAVNAEIPKYINFQGRLTDADGSPVADGSYSLTFRLYAAETGGTALWTEKQSVTATNGVFNAALGTVTAIGLSFDVPYWLSVQVSNDVEMSPRQRLTAAGYALNAENLDTLTSGQFIRSDADDSAAGQITLSYPGTVLIVQPSSAPAANTSLIDIRDTSGSTKFSVDCEGDTTYQNASIGGALDVTGTATLSDTLEVAGATTMDSSLTVGTNLLTVDTSTSRIGIGTTSPTKILDIAGNTGILGDLSIGSAQNPKNISVTGDLTVSGDQVIAGTTLYEGDLVLGADGQGHDLKLYSDTEGKYLLWDDATSKMVFAGLSNLEVGGSLDVTGSVTSGTWSGNAIGTQYGGTGIDSSATAVGNLLYFSDTGVVSALAPAETGKLLQSNETAAPSWATYTGNADIVSVGTLTTGLWRGDPIEAQYGGTGLNTSAWTGIAKVDSGTWSQVSPGSSGNVLYDTGTTWLAASVDTAGLVDKSTAQTIAGAKTFSDNLIASNEVNVGTDLDVEGIAYLDQANLADNEKIKLGTGEDVEIYVDAGDDLYIVNVNEDDDIYFQINDGGTAKTALFIDADTSRVGIGNNNPLAMMDIGGDFRLSGRIRQSSLGDLAEMMQLASKPKTLPANYFFEAPEAGDVVIIDEDGGIRRSGAAFAKNVIGIVSTDPAQVLREDLANAVAVAISGVVPCKVIVENGAIKPGDLLVSSSTPGYAMCAGDNPPAGTVIGKAMNRLDEGIGIIEVLVMMN